MFQLGAGPWSPEDLISKALDSTTASGQALIPQLVDPYIPELALQYSPFRQLIPRTPWKSGTFDKNKRTALGRARMVGDGTSAPETQSTFARFQESLKIMQGKGGVTGFMQAASQDLVDALQKEVAGATISAANEEACMILYGNKYADPFMFSGLEQWSQTGNANIVAADGTTVSASYLDSAIDTQQNRIGTILDPNNSFFVMSHKMLSKFSATLQSSGQRWNDMVEVPGGFRFKSYRNIPIVATSFIQSDQAWAGSTVTASPATSGGALADSYYRYKVSAVGLTGESLGSTSAVAQVTGGDGGGKVTLAWTAIPETRLYKIYRFNAGSDPGAGTEILHTEIPGTCYVADSFGFLTATDTASWVDNGSRVLQTTATSVVTGAAYTPGYAAATMDELQTGEEDIWLCTTSVPGIEGYTLHMPTLRDLSYMELATISDKKWFLVAGYYCLICIEQALTRITRIKNA